MENEVGERGEVNWRSVGLRLLQISKTQKSK